MKFWLAYKFRGADLDELKVQLAELRSLLEAKGHEVVTMIESIQNWNWQSQPKTEVLQAQYKLVKDCDAALCVYTSEDPSEGRGFDVGLFAGMGKPTIMAIHKSLSIPFTEAFYSENPANQQLKFDPVIRFESFGDMVDQIVD
ncbi:MAG: nucleoside 2-deoxyribosyltransferase [Patescibacteria group bacterium]|jgi:nucleoside 2-deoxyribosyltransferase